MPRMRLKPTQVLIALDQLLNSLIGGWADETFSARCWRLQNRAGWRFLRKAVDLLFFWDKNHCLESYASERQGRQLPPEYRKL